MAPAAELTELHDWLNDEVKKLQDIHFKMFGRHLEELHLRDMELCYELNRESWPVATHLVAEGGSEEGVSSQGEVQD